MKRLMKYVSIVLSVALIVTSISFSALADGEPQPLGDNHFAVDFDQWEWCENPEDRASVKVNEKNVNRNEPIVFASGSEIEFTLTSPTERSGYNPIVEIEIFDAEPTVPEFPDVDGSERKYSFSYTPASDKPFMVRIWWSEYDHFGYDDQEQFQITLCSPGRNDVIPETNPGCVSAATYPNTST